MKNKKKKDGSGAVETGVDADADPGTAAGAAAEAAPGGSAQPRTASAAGAPETQHPPAVSQAGLADVPKAAPAVDERLLRLQADFDNYRKRMLRERNELYLRANEDILKELVPVLDNVEVALEAASAGGTLASFVGGIRIVADQFLSVLGKFGVTVIDAEGKEFDPGLHEAVSHLPAPGVPENRVAKQIRRGYLLGDRVLRAAQVVVSSGDAPPSAGCDAGSPAASGGARPAAEAEPTQA